MAKVKPIDRRYIVGPSPDCPLASGAKQVVWGEGPRPAKFMLIGEAPGRREDWEGHAFVGPSGIRFDILLEVAGLTRADVYVTNVEKYRPPKNRNPKVAEMAACRPVLDAEILAVQPQVIITMGNIAAKTFDKGVQLKKDHGFPRPISVCTQSSTLVPMYHPAYSLRNPLFWPVLIDDFAALFQRLAVPASDVQTQYDLVTGGGYWGGSEVGFDLETTSPLRGGKFSVQEAEIVGYSTSSVPHKAIYSPTKPEGVAKEYLENKTTTIVAHNTKFEYGRLEAIGVKLNNFEDTKIAAYLLGYPSTHLKHLTRQELGIDPITYEQATGGQDMGDMDPQDILSYAAADPDHTLMLWQRVLRPELERMGLMELYKMEKKLVPVLAAIEKRGMLVDVEATESAVEYFMRHEQAAREAAVEAGVPEGLNIGSGDQLSPWLESIEAPITERTDGKGLLKTDSATLEAIRGFHPAIPALLDFKEKQKLKAFPNGFLRFMHDDGVLHPSLNQCGHFEETVEDASSSPASGRLSCSGPNMQQVPHHGRNKGKEYEEYGAIIRRCIVARPGHVFVAGDVGQQEPRVTAVVAPEPQLRKDLEDGIPIYAPVGELIFDRPIDKHDDEPEWHTAKTFWLAYTYGAGLSKLLELGIPKSQAEEAMEGLAKRYAGLTGFRNRVIMEIREHGYVRDYFGRVRWLPGAFAADPYAREAAYRQGINHHIQGPSATMIKIAMQRLYASGFHLVLQIHDEVILEVRNNPVEINAATEALKDMVAGLMPIMFPVDVKVGKNLGDLEEYNV